MIIIIINKTLGYTITGKSYKVSYKSKKTKKNPEEKQYFFPNTHETLIEPLQPGDELGRELGVARPVTPAQGVAQAHRRAFQLPFDAAAPAPLDRARTVFPDLGEGLADLLEDVAGLDSGEHGQKGPDVPLRPGGPEGLRVEALGIHVAEVHDEGGRLLPDGPLLLRQQKCVGLLVAVAPGAEIGRASCRERV